jgi:hypothetical protein
MFRGVGAILIFLRSGHHDLISYVHGKRIPVRHTRVLTSLSHMLDTLTVLAVMATRRRPIQKNITVYDKVLENFESDEVQLLDVWLLYECF